MRLRTRTLVATTIASATLAVFAVTANANAPESSGDGSKPAPTCEETSSCKPTTPDTPVTPETPVTVTETTPEVPDLPTTETPELPDEVPQTPDLPVEDTPTITNVPDVPSTPGGGDLPFTGPGDVMLAIAIALLAGTGGMLLLLGAGPREALERLNRRTMASPSAFRVAYREHLKRQLEE
ncbi:MAG: hypothetical protein JWO69_1820 [Thermoleophilia bacterium]|nr:hypothetical protein [Thermoleophilia bacterium]